MRCVACYCITVLLICALPGDSVQQTSKAADTPFNLAPNQCLSADLPEGITEWQLRISPPHTSVGWGYDHTTCSSMNKCFGLHLPDDISLEPQITPLQIQQGMQVRFFPSPNMDVRFSIWVFRIDEIGFRSCDHARGRPITASPQPKEFNVAASFLSIGTNYFIANTTDPLYECRYGLRLNVTVRTQDCYNLGDSRRCTDRGRCVANAIQPKYECSCCHGYTGRYCQDEDACASSPCQNGGQCTDVTRHKPGKEFSCQCPLGFYGGSCERRVSNMCEVSPCDNNGTCVGSVSNYTCICPHGYSGYHCEVDVNNCENKPCVHGVCVDDLGGYRCYCTPGYGGRNCDREFDECQSNPCRNGGFCINLQDGFQCHCTRGYKGPDCSIKIDLCDPSPCQNATECVDFGHDFSCTCHPGYTGIHCEININECASNPCLNGAKCRDRPAGYTCLCPENISGAHCEYKRLNLPRRPPPPRYDDGSLEHLHVNKLYIVAGTLAGSLLIALAVLAGCYCKVHETYRKFYWRKDGYTKHHNEALLQKKAFSAHQVAAQTRPSTEAIIDATPSVGYSSGTQHTPLVNSLKPRRI